MARPGSSIAEEARCQQFAASVPFAYRCDRCHATVLRPARQLVVFCSETCRRAFRAGRRRLKRNFRGVRRWPAEELWDLDPPDPAPHPKRGPPLDSSAARDKLVRDDDADEP